MMGVMEIDGDMKIDVDGGIEIDVGDNEEGRGSADPRPTKSKH